MTAITPDLEALEALRDMLFLDCCKSGSTADWERYEAVSAELRTKLLARLDSYLNRPWPDSPTITIDLEGCDRWLDSHSAADYLPESEG